MVGIVQHGDGTFACFLGQKLDRIVSETSDEVMDDEAKQIVFRREARRKLKLVMYEDMQPLVDHVNNNGYSWKAQLHDRYQGLSLAQVADHIKLGGRPLRRSGPKQPLMMA